MEILEKNPVPLFVAKCGQCQSRFTYAKKDAAVSRGGWRYIPTVWVLTCPVCSGGVICDFVPHVQEAK